MNRSKKIIVNTLLMTLTSLLMRAIGMSFQVYLTKNIGAAGIGLFQLIMSVYMLFTTFALSGIRFAATRLISEELGLFPNGTVSKVVRKCLVYALIFGTAATIILLFTAEYIGLLWIKDTRAVLSLKVISVSLPFLAMSAVFSGYFTAVSRVFKSAVCQFIEQLSRIGLVFLIFTRYGASDIETACAVIMAGGVLGDFVSFALQYILYLFDRRRYAAPRQSKRIVGRMVEIAAPLALSSYARTALSTLQQLLVPAGFKKYGLSAEQALADYGAVHGMAIPIITFPSALFYALGDVIVPDLTEAQVQGKQDRIDNLVNRTLRMCILVSFGLAVILFRFSYELGDLFYKIHDVGRYVRILSFILPVMYLDSITDGLLRGLGQHLYVMWVNIADSVASVILVYILLPKTGVAGYLFMICFTEAFNFALSLFRLSKMVHLRFDFKAIVLSLVSALGSVNIAMLILRNLGILLSSTVLSMVSHILLSLVLYYLTLRIFRCVEESDIKLIRNIFRKDVLS